MDVQALRELDSKMLPTNRGEERVRTSDSQIDLEELEKGLAAAAHRRERVVSGEPDGPSINYDRPKQQLQQAEPATSQKSAEKDKNVAENTISGGWVARIRSQQPGKPIFTTKTALDQDKKLENAKKHKKQAQKSKASGFGFQALDAYPPNNFRNSHADRLGVRNKSRSEFGSWQELVGQPRHGGANLAALGAN